jgi:hypothetical protein
MMSEDRSKLLDTISTLGEQMQEYEDKYELETDKWWDELSEEDRERAFYSVVKRIVEGELRDRGTYRYILYDVFGFDASAYVMGMDCGFMELHNSIYTREEMRELRDRELAAAGVKVITSEVKMKDTL